MELIEAYMFKQSRERVANALYKVSENKSTPPVKKPPRPPRSLGTRYTDQRFNETKEEYFARKKKESNRFYYITTGIISVSIIISVIFLILS